MVYAYTIMLTQSTEVDLDDTEQLQVYTVHADSRNRWLCSYIATNRIELKRKATRMACPQQQVSRSKALNTLTATTAHQQLTHTPKPGWPQLLTQKNTAVLHQNPPSNSSNKPNYGQKPATKGVWYTIWGRQLPKLSPYCCTMALGILIHLMSYIYILPHLQLLIYDLISAQRVILVLCVF